MKEKATIGDTISKTVKRELHARNQAQAQLERLQQGLSEYQGKCLKLKGEIDEAVKVISRLVAEGSSPDKVQSNVVTLRAQLASNEDISFQIEENSLPQAREHLRTVQVELESSVREAMVPLRQDTERQMAKLMDKLMALVDTFDSQSRETFKSLKVGLTAGSTEMLVRCEHERFYRFCQAGGVKPIAEKSVPLPERPPTPPTPRIPPEPHTETLDVSEPGEEGEDAISSGSMTVSSPGDVPEQQAEKG